MGQRPRPRAQGPGSRVHLHECFANLPLALDSDEGVRDGEAQALAGQGCQSRATKLTAVEAQAEERDTGSTASAPAWVQPRRGACSRLHTPHSHPRGLGWQSRLQAGMWLPPLPERLSCALCGPCGRAKRVVFIMSPVPLRGVSTVLVPFLQWGK